MKWILLMTGGVLGTVMRYLVTHLSAKFITKAFPVGTFIVNIVGCLLLGFFMQFDGRKFFSDPHMRMFLIIGFCGAFTTFSTWIWDHHAYIESGEWLKLLLNLLVSLTIGILLIRLGAWMGSLYD